MAFGIHVEFVLLKEKVFCAARANGFVPDVCRAVREVVGWLNNKGCAKGQTAKNLGNSQVFAQKRKLAGGVVGPLTKSGRKPMTVSVKDGKETGRRTEEV